MLSIEQIRQINLFRDAPEETLQKIIPLLQISLFPEGFKLFSRGDPGNSMFIILEGEVDVTLTNDEGIEYTIAHLRQGDIVGEMALLTGEPRSANVNAHTDLRTIELDQDCFEQIVGIMPELNIQLLRLLATRLGMSASRRQEDLIESKQLLATVLSGQRPPDTDVFPGTTKWAKQVNESIRSIAGGEANVMILGEIGTGKELVARLIHYGASGQPRPFFTLDCANVPPVLNEKGGELLFEVAQQAALFGHEPGSAVYAIGTRRGYLELADGGSLMLENVEFLTPTVQEQLADYLRTGSFSRIGEEETLHSKVRIISTASSEIKQMAEASEFDAGLFDLLSGETINMAPLRERKKDIPILAEYYLDRFSRKARKEIAGFSKNAMNALVDYSWPSNMTELEQVISRAVAICREDRIRSENIFLDVSSFSSEGKINLLKIDRIANVLRHPLFPAAITYFTVPFFIFLILYTLLGPVENNIANVISWTLLWPALILSIAFSARSWCGYCPMAAISNAVAFRRSKFLEVPGVIKKHGIWFGIFGFIMILWAEHITHMAERAHGTGVLFLSIVGGAIVITSVFGRRVWCLYLCPLGRMIGQFATVSMLELRSNSNVCLTQCMTHDCIKDKNCPMGLHPSSTRVGQDCIMCLSCVKRCTHKSIHIDALFPKQKLLSLGKWEFPRAFFSVTLTASVLALKLPAWIGSHEFAASRMPAFFYEGGALADLAVYLGIIAFYIALTVIASVSRSRNVWKNTFIHSGYAYLPLAFFGLLNVYFREFISMGHQIPVLAVRFIWLDGLIRPEWVTPNLVTLKGLVPIITLFGLGFSIYLLKGIKLKYNLSSSAHVMNIIVMSLTAIVFLIIL